MRKHFSMSGGGGEGVVANGRWQTRVGRCNHAPLFDRNPHVQAAPTTMRSRRCTGPASSPHMSSAQLSAKGLLIRVLVLAELSWTAHAGAPSAKPSAFGSLSGHRTCARTKRHRLPPIRTKLQACARLPCPSPSNVSRARFMSASPMVLLSASTRASPVVRGTRPADALCARLYAQARQHRHRLRPLRR